MSKMFLIGNSHIDPVWLWRWQEGFSEILATFRSALDRMKDFENFKYTSACSVYYELIEKIDPQMFEEIKQRVKEGRWSIVGGWVLQPDCNIPTGESFARHALIAQRYFKDKFGVTAKTAYNVDSFGHCAALPKILRESGMENYVFMRPNIQEQGRDEQLFSWVSDDGSAVTAYRIPKSYGIGSSEIIQNLYDEQKDGTHDFMCFFGVGNHGGGPTIKLIEEINALKTESIYSTPDEYFDSVKAIPLPAIMGELQHHARGCYSACSFIKSANRRCEQNLIATEKLCVMANKLIAYDYPSKKLRKAWKNLLFNQFHDILGGCSIKKAYEDASYLSGETMSITEQELYFAMQKIANNIDTLEGESLPTVLNKNKKTWEHEKLGIPVVIFNPHTYEVKTCITVNEDAKRVVDERGNEIPHQTIRGDYTSRLEKYHAAFIADIPALGYTTYSLFVTKECEKKHENEFTATANRIENSRIYVEFDESTGDFSKLYDKQSGKLIINGLCEAILLDETECDTWAHDMKQLGKKIGAFRGAELRLIESGPVRATVRSTVKYNNSVLIRDFTVLASNDEVQVKTRIDFHEQHKTLKFTFPMTNSTVTSEIAFGKITRPAYTGEEPCGCYVANGDLALATDSKYAYDTEDGQLRLTVLRSAIYADHHGVRDEFCEYMEQGIHEFTYSVYPHRNISETQKKANILNFAPRYIVGGFHNGSLPKCLSCFECDSNNVLVSCIKQSEDNNQAIMRIYEIEGIDTNVKIKLFDKTITSNISHNAIKTLTEDGILTNIIENT